MTDYQPPPQNPSSISDFPPPATSVISEAALHNEEEQVRCANFRQQELWAWKPVWSPRVVSIMYIIVALIFIPIGIVIFIQSRNMFITPRYRYDTATGCAPLSENSTEPSTDRVCNLPIIVKKEVQPPIYLYYGLVNFYQNARTYVTSRNDKQLRGESVSIGSSDACTPLIRNDTTKELLYPCGLVANSFFNDTLTLCDEPSCNQPVPNVTKKGIAWDVDVDFRFKAAEDATEEQRAKIEDEEFMNWMRLSAYRNWKKLYRIVNTKLTPGTYYIRAESKFPVESFGGEKFFFLATTTWFGGPNQILGLSFIVVGGLALVFSIMFIIQARMLVEIELPEQTSIDLGDIVKKKLHESDGMP